MVHETSKTAEDLCKKRMDAEEDAWRKRMELGHDAL